MSTNFLVEVLQAENSGALKTRSCRGGARCARVSNLISRLEIHGRA